MTLDGNAVRVTLRSASAGTHAIVAVCNGFAGTLETSLATTGAKSAAPSPAPTLVVDVAGTVDIDVTLSRAAGAGDRAVVALVPIDADASVVDRVPFAAIGALDAALEADRAHTDPTVAATCAYGLGLFAFNSTATPRCQEAAGAALRRVATHGSEARAAWASAHADAAFALAAPTRTEPRVFEATSRLLAGSTSSLSPEVAAMLRCRLAADAANDGDAALALTLSRTAPNDTNIVDRLRLAAHAARAATHAALIGDANESIDRAQVLVEADPEVATRSPDGFEIVISLAQSCSRCSRSDDAFAWLDRLEPGSLPADRRAAWLGTRALAELGSARWSDARRTTTALRSLVDTGSDDAFSVSTASVVAQLELALGAPERARASLSAGLPYATTDRERAVLRLNLAVADLEQERVEVALSGLEQSLEIATRAKLHDVAGIVRANLVEVHLLRGDATAAVEAARVACATSPVTPRTAAFARSMLARACADAGLTDEAIREAGDLLDEVDSSALRDAHLVALEALATARLDRGELDAAKSALDTLESMLDDDAVAALGPLDRSGLRSRYALAMRLREDACWREFHEVGNAADAATRDALVDALLARSTKFKSDMLRGGPRGRSGTASGILAAVRSVLEDDECLIEFVEGRSRMHAYVIPKSGPVRLADCGSVADVALAAAEFARIAASKSAATAEAAAAGARCLDLLRPAFDVVVGLGASKSTIAPSACLAGVPFDALPRLTAADAESPPYLIAELDIGIAPTAAIFSRPTDSDPTRPDARWVFVGDPNYAATDGTIDAGFRPLPATRLEVIAAARLVLDEHAASAVRESMRKFEKDRDSRFDCDTASILLGDAANVADVLEAVVDARYLHFACHGVHVPDADRVGLLLSPSPTASGFLDVETICRLKLRCDLALIIACDTTQGRLRATDGPLSVAHAWMTAGVWSVIASRWALNDENASALVASFQQRFVRERMNARAALRTTKLETLKSGSRAGVAAGEEGPIRWPPPYQWASLVLIGPGVDPDSDRR
ncbi:MAG: CHAT domain-containing protein [Planctomycetes bacterium]|nr:CHAT domain-containing protein [Planctomycetota bacterium]MCC7169736.1 CHAT domain-containing protein [Planctomycetota bacterium]